MAMAQTLMVFILIVSFGVLAAVFIFWINSGKLVQAPPRKQAAKNKKKTAKKSKNLDLDFGSWETTTLLLR
jgi:hypothetical protein